MSQVDNKPSRGPTVTGSPGRRATRWLWVAAVSLVVWALLVAVVGWILPSQYVVTRTLEIQAPPQNIHRYIGDLNQWAQWTPFKKSDPTLKIIPGDTTKGPGASQSWTGKSGNGYLVFTQSEPQTGVKYDLYFEDGWECEAKIAYGPGQEPQHTQVTWTMEGKVGANPIARYVALLMDSTAGPMFAEGLHNLKELVEEPRPSAANN